MNTTTTAFALFIAACTIYKVSISVSAFAPPASPSKAKTFQLNYLREVGTSGVTNFALNTPLPPDDDVVNPIEEAFDNMKHPMELMLMNRACIPYVAEGRPARSSKATTKPSIKPNQQDNNKNIIDDIDPIEEVFDNMKHPMELMLMNRACIPYVAEVRPARPVKKSSASSPVVSKDETDDFVDPIEEAFDNMKHPMELMLMDRACIPYVAEVKTTKKKVVTKKPVANTLSEPINDDQNDDDFVDPLEEAFENMKHPMEFMLLSEWRQWRFGL